MLHLYTYVFHLYSNYDEINQNIFVNSDPTVVVQHNINELVQNVVQVNEIPVIPPVEVNNLLNISMNDPTISPTNRIIWNDCVNIDTDPATAVYNGNTSFKWSTILNDLANSTVHTPIQYFKLLFPMQYLNTIINATNNRINSLHNGGSEINYYKFFRYIGIRLTMAANPCCSNVQEYFNATEIKNSVQLPQRYEERFNMCYNEFRRIGTVLRLAVYEENDSTVVSNFTIISFVLTGFI